MQLQNMQNNVVVAQHPPRSVNMWRNIMSASMHLHVNEDIIFLTVYHAKFLSLDFHKYLDEFLKKRHQRRFICVTTHRRDVLVQITGLIPNFLCPDWVIQIANLSELLGYKPRIAYCILLDRILLKCKVCLLLHVCPICRRKQL
jgi:hypothetical protein